MFKSPRAWYLGMFFKWQNAPPLEGPIKFAEWHTPPPPDPIFARRLMRTRWEIGLGAIGIALLIGFALYANLFFPLSYWFIAFLVPGYWMIRTRRAVPAVAPLMDLPSTGGQFPVELTYSCGKAPFGCDTGIIRFDGQWMNFEGLESQFSIRRNDVAVKLSWMQENRRKGRFTMLTAHLKYTLDGVPFSVVISPLDAIAGVGKGFRYQFCAATTTWDANNEMRVGQTLFPPVGVTDRSLAANLRNARIATVLFALGLPVSLYWLSRTLLSESPHPEFALPIPVFWVVALQFAFLYMFWGRVGVLRWLRSNSVAELLPSLEGGAVPTVQAETAVETQVLGGRGPW